MSGTVACSVVIEQTPLHFFLAWNISLDSDKSSSCYQTKQTTSISAIPPGVIKEKIVKNNLSWHVW